ncbi:MAG: metallophosphoesterase [Clostridia bacterium]|nr:metallophosphoesterase [Clostridia bacterium]
MKIFFPWIAMFAAVQCALTLIQWLLRKKQIKKSLRIIIIIAKALIAIACAVLVLAGPVFFRPVQPVMVVIYAVLFMDAFAEVIYAIYLACTKKERKFVPLKLLSLILGILFFVYGTVNMEIITPQYHTYSSAKIKEEHTIIFAADMHVGSAQSMETTAKMIEAMKAENPDYIILGGDITDDYTSKEDMEKTYRLFGETGVPVYFIFGNHEVVQHAEYMKNGLPYTEEELVQTMEANGITVLADAYADLAPDLLLLGREDAAAKELRKDIGTLPNPAPDKYLVVADHQPTEAKDNLAAGTDLQLSGHTHAGQLFPNGFFFSFVSYTRGNYDLGEGANMYVSSGTSGWRVPFRTESHCHYEVIHLQPENAQSE